MGRGKEGEGEGGTYQEEKREGKVWSGYKVNNNKNQSHFPAGVSPRPHLPVAFEITTPLCLLGLTTYICICSDFHLHTYSLIETESHYVAQVGPELPNSLLLKCWDTGHMLTFLLNLL